MTPCGRFITGKPMSHLLRVRLTLARLRVTLGSPYVAPGQG